MIWTRDVLHFRPEWALGYLRRGIMVNVRAARPGGAVRLAGECIAARIGLETSNLHLSNGCTP